MAATLTDKPAKAPRPPREPKAPKPPKERAPKERAPRPERPAKPAKGPKPPRRAAPAPRAEDWGDPVKPTMNLLPHKARGIMERRRATRGALLVSAGMLALAAVGYASVLGNSAVAESNLQREQSLGQAHQAELGKYQHVQDFSDGIDARRAAAASALDRDVSYANVLGAVTAADTVGASFDAITTSQDPAGCPAPNPFAPSLAIGCLQLSGTAPSPIAVGQLVTALGNDPSGVLTSPYATESAAGDHGLTSFKISVGFTDKGLSRLGQKFAPATGPGATTAPAAGAGVPAPTPTKEATK